MEGTDDAIKAPADATLEASPDSVAPEVPLVDACVPAGCSPLRCGHVGDGCGAILDCGACSPPEWCGGGGVPNRCGGASGDAGGDVGADIGSVDADGGCVAKTCASLSYVCGGLLDDGCGRELHCGNCPEGMSCVRIACTRCIEVCQTCVGLGADCGFVGDGLGGVLDCGTCTAPATCGGGGTPNKCGTTK